VIRRHGGRLRSGAGALLVTLAVCAALVGGYLALRHAATIGDAAGAPAARAGAAMAYDPASGDVVMFGGTGAGGQPLADTWLWDGSGWSPASPADSPPARYDAQMAWDPLSQRLILLGGTGGSGCSGGTTGGGVTSSSGGCTQLQDAWAWSGSDWAALNLGQGTGQLGDHSLAGATMATDPATGRLVLVTTGSPISTVTPLPAIYNGGMTGASASAGASSAGGSASGASSGSTGSGEPCIGVGGGPCGSPVTAPTPVSVPPVETACPLTTGCVSLPCTATGATCSICPVASSSSPAAGTQVICSNCTATATPCALMPATLTWVFDGSGFQEVAADPAAAPPSGGDLVWFPGPGRLVDLVPDAEAEMGGPAISCPLDAPCPIMPAVEDWDWNGSGWTATDVTSTSSAQPSFGVAPVTDTTNGEAVGVDSAGDTWVSTDPTSGWTETASAGPAARFDFAIADDASSGQVVLFGGDLVASTSTSPTVVGDTWTWDGTGWTQQGGSAPSPTPSASATPVASAVTAPSLPPSSSATGAPATAVRTVTAPATPTPAATPSA